MLQVIQLVRHHAVVRRAVLVTVDRHVVVLAVVVPPLCDLSVQHVAGQKDRVRERYGARLICRVGSIGAAVSIALRLGEVAGADALRVVVYRAAAAPGREVCLVQCGRAARE